MNYKKIAALILGASLAVSMAACSSSDAPTEENTPDATAELETARLISMAGITANTAIQFGIEHGDFSAEGLDASLAEVENPPAAIAAMQGGNAEFAYAPLSTALSALSQGIGIHIVAAAEGFPDDGVDADSFDDTGLVINPNAGLNSVADLSHETVGIPARGGMMEVVIANAIEEAGGDPSQVDWQALDQQSQIAALKQERISAAGLATPFTDQAESEGMEVILRPKAIFFEHGAAGVWITTVELAEKNPGLIEKFQAAVNKANSWANDHLDEMAERIVTDFKLDTNSEDVTVGHFPPRIFTADVERATAKMQTLGFLPADLDISNVVIEPK